MFFAKQTMFLRKTTAGSASVAVRDNTFRAFDVSRSPSDTRRDSFQQPMNTQLQTTVPTESVSILTRFHCDLSEPVLARGDFYVESTTPADKPCVSLSLSTPDGRERVVKSQNKNVVYRNVSQTPQDAVTYVFYRNGREFQMTVSDGSRQRVATPTDVLTRYQQIGGPGAVYRGDRRVNVCETDPDNTDRSTENFSSCQTFALK